MRKFLVAWLCFNALPAQADWVTKSACLGTKPSATTRLAKVREEAKWFLNPSGDEAWEPGENDPRLKASVCLDAVTTPGQRAKIIYLRNHVAVVFWVDVAGLVEVPVTPDAWLQSRGLLEEGEERGETGCLKEFGPGTLFYDRPDGRVVGVVTGGTVWLGGWGTDRRRSGTWAKTAVRPNGAWLKDTARSWCPE